MLEWEKLVALKVRMYGDMVNEGLIDGLTPVEDYTVEQLWQIVMDYFEKKEIF